MVRRGESKWNAPQMAMARLMDSPVMLSVQRSISLPIEADPSLRLRCQLGDHKGAPLLWTSLASRFVGIVGAHPCGRPAGVPIRLSSPDKPM